MPNSSNSTVTPLPFEFTGSAREYFGIWVTNLLLTLVTLGIYSAWAKVRNTQYIYSHTRLTGAGFEYTARPKDILKGRAIAVGILCVYFVAIKFWPFMEMGFLICFIIVFPFLIVASLKFRYRNTRYRNIRFKFSGTYTDAAKEFLLWPLLLIPSLGLALPYIRCRQSRFLVGASHYGNGKFKLQVEPRLFYSIFYKSFALLLLGMVISFSIFLIAYFMFHWNDEANIKLIASYIFPRSIFLILPLMGFVFIYSSAKIRNLIYNSAVVRSHHMESTLSVRSLAFLWITNQLAIVFSLGLAIPWATIRMTRYYAAHTIFHAGDDLDTFIQEQSSEENALGQEMADFMDLEIGL